MPPGGAGTGRVFNYSEKAPLQPGGPWRGQIPPGGAGIGHALTDFEKAPFKPVNARGRMIPPGGAGTGHALTYFEDASFQPDDDAWSGMVPQGGQALVKRSITSRTPYFKLPLCLHLWTL